METSDGMEIVYISSQHHDGIDICQSFAFVLFVFCENAFFIKKKNKTKNHVTKQNKLTNKQFLIVLLIISSKYMYF